MRVFTLATQRQYGDKAATGDPPKVVERERLRKKEALLGLRAISTY